MQPADELFVASCTHVHENEEWDACAQRRLGWLHEAGRQGMSVKVALLAGEHAGFLYLLPIEIAPAGPVGRDLAVIQCLTVKGEARRCGAGRALVAATVQEARRRGSKGVVVTAFYHDFWFMPAPFFEKCGFAVARRRENAAILWKAFDDTAEAPGFLQRRYEFTPVEGKVLVELFWSRSCLTVDAEAQRVREVAAEFGDAVELRQYCSEDAAVRSRYGIFRAIFINGEEIGWGYEAPREGIRQAIHDAVAGTANGQ
jgi:N-acetylglutamate synthase-like GNAT family acetyltransferase